MVKRMKRTSEIKTTNALYVIATPIGNLSDISLRALSTLKSLDFLYCEDTRKTAKLLSHYDISLPTDSYHDYSDQEKEDKIISLLKMGKNVGLVSDCGTPIISDPGYEVVRRVIKEGIRVIPIPGASAQVEAMILSALPPKPYLFYGFLDHNEKKRKEELSSLKDYPFTMVFYESPLRLKSTLRAMNETMGDREVSIAREITKIYEETIYLSLSEYNEVPDDLKGEMVIVLSGKKEEVAPIIIDYISEMNTILRDGTSLKEASKMLAKKTGRKASDIYNEYIREKKQ